jgi:hypothetical protein
MVGKSGTGKSNLMLTMFQTDSFYRNAKVLIEPSGFLALDAYSLAKGQAHYVSLDSPISINPMELDYPPDTISDLVAESVNQVITLTTPTQPLTAKMRDILDGSIKWNLERNRKSLLHVRDHIASLTGDAQTRDGILARLNFLLNDSRIEKILCGRQGIKWGELIEKGQTFILDCFGMTREKMIFVGSLITFQIKSYFRHERPKVYRPLRIYIDECHNFINFNLLDILKEGRKFKLSVVMATVDFSNIDSRLVHAMCNVGTLVAYKLGAREAQILAREMDITPQELMFLEKYHLAYMTPRNRGFCKAPRPPFIKKIARPKGAPAVKRKWKGWFPMEPAG